MIMAGSLGEWSVDDLLQIARITQKTTSIQVIGPNRKGVVYARKGRLVDVELEPDPRTSSDRMGRLVEGVALLAAIGEGTFEFGTHEVPEGGQSMDIKEVLRAIERDVLRERKLADLGIVDDQPLAVRATTDTPVTLDPPRWRLIAEMIGPFTVAALEDQLGRRLAVGAVLMLDAGGLLERLPERETTPAGPVVDVAPRPEAPAPIIGEPPATAPCSPAPDATNERPEPGAPIVEIFDTMHEVVTPSETTLVSGVLDDLHTRFRTSRYNVQRTM